MGVSLRLPEFRVEAFGDKFRKERERRGFSLDDVANATKISARMLQAIEDERFDLLPGGVFNKGFIRAYAHHLGMNDQEAASQYVLALREAQIGAVAAFDRAHDPRPQTQSTPPQAENLPFIQTPLIAKKKKVEELPDLHLPIAEHVRPRREISLRSNRAPGWKIPALVFALIAVGIIFWTRHSRSAHANATTPPAAPVVATAPSALAAPGQVTTPAAANPAASASATDAGDNFQEVIKRTFSPARKIPVAPKSPKPFTLVIRASETSRISVTADGQFVSDETLIAPAHTSVRGTREVVVKVANAGAVSFLLNGKEIPAHGAKSEPKTFVFDNSGIRTPD